MKILDVRGLVDLAPLRAFGDLEDLRLERARGLDLGVLGDLEGLERFEMRETAATDFRTWRTPSTLRDLVLLDLDDDCAIPDALGLPDDTCRGAEVL